jgi:pimeloyl-ACP methyl ester carboxylesterase
MAQFWIGFIIVLAGLALVGFVAIMVRYSREIRDVRRRLDNLGSQVIETDYGPIEYAQFGDGYPVLVVHGALGGFDHGLWLAHSFSVTDYRVISISRFGYMGSPIPADANLNLQADIFAGLLDTLKIRRVAVFAISAGSTTAIRFAARHPERISALVLLGPDAPGKVQLTMPPRFVFETLFRSDFIYWILITFFRKGMQRMMGLVPQGFKLASEHEALINTFLAAILPVSRRTDGLIYESYNLTSEFHESVSPASPYPLGMIKTPVLVINALDDPLAIPENVHALADLMPAAQLYIVPNGGHFFFGHAKEVTAKIQQFMHSHAAAPQNDRQE